MAEDLVLIEKSGSKLTITLNRPEAINALTVEMFDAINKGLDQAQADDEVRVVVLKGAGTRGFSSGLDRKEMEKLRGEGSLAIYHGVYGTAKRIDTFPKPVIALIQGHCIAAAGQLATAADFIIAGESLKILEPELRMGGFNDESWPLRLGQTLGPIRAKAYVLMGVPLSAEEALRVGLVSLVVPDSELEATGDKWAEQFATYQPNVVTKTLEAIDRGSSSVRGPVGELKPAR